MFTLYIYYVCMFDCEILNRFTYLYTATIDSDRDFAYSVFAKKADNYHQYFNNAATAKFTVNSMARKFNLLGNRRPARDV